MYKKAGALSGGDLRATQTSGIVRRYQGQR
jgi:hypothetical protein